MSTTAPTDRLARAIDATGALIDGVKSDQWSDPTPCPEWNVRALVNHLVGGNRLFVRILSGEEMPPPETLARLRGADQLTPKGRRKIRESARYAVRFHLAPGVEPTVTADGKKLPGLGLVDLHTVPGARRNIGNIVIETSDLGLTPRTLVGFENHSGKTYLGPGLQPLGRVLRGAGNNGEDGFEGVASGNIFGTYLHGSLLPKNPHFADLLLLRALRRRGFSRLEPLDDSVEMSAHRSVKERVTSR